MTSYYRFFIVTKYKITSYYRFFIVTKYKIMFRKRYKKIKINITIGQFTNALAIY